MAFTTSSGTPSSPAADVEAPDRERKETIQVLIVDDERTLRESCGSLLKSEGFEVVTCGRGGEAVDLLERRRFDIVLCDVFMEPVSGLDVLAKVQRSHPDTLVILMTGKPSVESSINALRSGAWDYLPKPFSAGHLAILMGRAAHAVVVARESRQVQKDLAVSHGHSEKVTLLGQSPAFREVIDLARKVARTDASVFLTGESGTGKEVIAQFIHAHSRRSSRELVPVNCAAIPEALLESEMFGHVAGAFTGAVRDKEGLLEVAHGGTFFLDELTEMPLPVQAKLLRVLQDGVVRRVGSTATDAVVNVRFIAATNVDPMTAVQDGRLRKDLHFRLRVVPIAIPPLRERPEDVPVLARHFLASFWKQHRGPEAEPAFSDAALEALMRRPWMGNVRELRNVIEHSVVFADPGAPIEPEDLPVIESWEPEEDASRFYGPHLFRQDYHTARDRVLGDFEKDYLSFIVKEARGNISDAARLAAVDRTTLYRLMEKHGTARDKILSGYD